MSYIGSSNLVPSGVCSSPTNHPMKEGLFQSDNPFDHGERLNFPAIEDAMDSSALSRSPSSPSPSLMDLSIGALAALNEHLRHVAKYGIDNNSNIGSSNNSISFDDPQKEQEHDYSEEQVDQGVSKGKSQKVQQLENITSSDTPRNPLDEKWEHLVDDNLSENSFSLTSCRQSSRNGIDRLERTTPIKKDDIYGTFDALSENSNYFNSSRVLLLKTPERDQNRQPNAAVTMRGDDSFSTSIGEEASSFRSFSPSSADFSRDDILFLANMVASTRRGEEKVTPTPRTEQSVASFPTTDCSCLSHISLACSENHSKVERNPPNSSFSKAIVPTSECCYDDVAKFQEIKTGFQGSPNIAMNRQRSSRIRAQQRKPRKIKIDQSLYGQPRRQKARFDSSSFSERGRMETIPTAPDFEKNFGSPLQGVGARWSTKSLDHSPIPEGISPIARRTGDTNSLLLKHQQQQGFPLRRSSSRNRHVASPFSTISESSLKENNMAEIKFNVIEFDHMRDSGISPLKGPRTPTNMCLLNPNKHFSMSAASNAQMSPQSEDRRHFRTVVPTRVFFQEPNDFPEQFDSFSAPAPSLLNLFDNAVTKQTNKST